MNKSLMSKLNWILVISGVLITYFGLFLSYFITTNYDGLYAFFTVLTIVSGLVLVVLGLAVNFNQKD